MAVRAETRRDRTLSQKLALLFGIAFLGAGILGFIPGITTDYGDMTFAGKDSGAQLLGIFQTSVLHNLVHGLFGIAGLVMARRIDTARSYLLYSGLIYVVLFVYGLFVGAGDDANFVPIDNGDDWLHLVLAIGLLGSWVATRGERVGDIVVGDRATGG